MKLPLLKVLLVKNNFLKKSKLFIIIFLLFNLKAEQNSIGIGIIDSVNSKQENKIFAVPLVNWQIDKFYFKGIKLGYAPVRGFDLFLQPNFAEQGDSLETGFSLGYRFFNLNVELNNIFYTAGMGNGWRTVLKISKPVIFDSLITIPSFLIESPDRAYLHYHYPTLQKSERSIITNFGFSSMNIYNLNADYGISFLLNIQFLDKKLVDLPEVENGWTSFGFVSFFKKF